MIENIEQLKLSQEALKDVEKSLFSLKEKVFDDNPALFKAMSEDYIKSIEELSNEINEFIGANYFYKNKAQLWIRLAGSQINLWSTPSSVWSSILNKIRNSIYSISKLFIPPELISNEIIDEYFKTFSDFPVVELEKGSLKIGLSYPSKLQYELFENDNFDNIEKIIDQSLKKFLEASNWFEKGIDISELNEIFPNEIIRDFVISKVLGFIPSSKSKYQLVEFSGSISPIEKPIKLVQQYRKRIKEIINLKENESELTVEGVIREIDLDVGKCILRQRPDGLEDLKCKFYSDIMEQMKEALDYKVRIVGYLKNNKAPIYIKIIEILEAM